MARGLAHDGEAAGAETRLSPLVALQSTLEAQGYRVSLNLLAPGTVFGDHCACSARIDAVFAGQLRVIVGGVSRVLGPGDWVEIPAGAVTSAEVIGDEPVLGLDATRD